VDERGGFLLGALAAAVVPLRRLHLGMAGELLDGANVGAGVEQIADEAAAEIVRREHLDLGRRSSSTSEEAHRLAGEPPRAQLASLVDAPEQGARRRTAEREPLLEGEPAAVGDVADALLVALAADDQRAGLGIVVGQVEADRLGAA